MIYMLYLVFMLFGFLLNSHNRLFGSFILISSTAYKDKRSVEDISFTTRKPVILETKGILLLSTSNQELREDMGSDSPLSALWFPCLHNLFNDLFISNYRIIYQVAQILWVSTVPKRLQRQREFQH